MPIEISEDSEERRMWIGCTGVVTDADLGAMVAASVRGLESRRFDAIVVDFEGIERIDVSTGAVSAAGLGNRNQPVTDGVKMAVIAPSDLAYGMARMYQLSRDDGDAVQVFRARAAALDWLAEAVAEGRMGDRQDAR